MLSQPAARADLTVVGGTAAQQEVIKSVFKCLPGYCHGSCPLCVQLLDNQAMDSYIRQGAGEQAVTLNIAAIDGIYQDTIPTITLRGSSANIEHNFTHECGHHVWQDVLTAAQRAAYTKIYTAQRASHHLVSQYAAVSVEEGFAEAFAYYVMQQSTLSKNDPLSMAYLNDILQVKTASSAPVVLVDSHQHI
jgi:hypothetical protein